VQVDVALQVNRAGEEHALGHDHAPAAGLCRRVDRAAEGGGAVGLAVGLRAEAGHREIAIRESGGLDPGEKRVQSGPGVVRGASGAARGDGGERGQRLPARTDRHQHHYN
jgi:hypothetical protein